MAIPHSDETNVEPETKAKNRQKASADAGDQREVQRDVTYTGQTPDTAVASRSGVTVVAQQPSDTDNPDVISDAYFSGEFLKMLIQGRMAGLRLRGRIPADGNCMFTALTDQIKRIRNVRIEPRILRRTIANYLRENPYSVYNTHLRDFLDEDWNAYLTEIASTSRWGDHLVLYGAAALFDMEIHVISSLGKNASQVINADTAVESPDDVCLLGHVAEAHYVSLERDPDAVIRHDQLKGTLRKTGPSPLTGLVTKTTLQHLDVDKALSLYAFPSLTSMARKHLIAAATEKVQSLIDANDGLRQLELLHFSDMDYNNTTVFLISKAIPVPEGAIEYRFDIPEKVKIKVIEEGNHATQSESVLEPRQYVASHIFSDVTSQIFASHLGLQIHDAVKLQSLARVPTKQGDTSTVDHSDFTGDTRETRKIFSIENSPTCVKLITGESDSQVVSGSEKVSIMIGNDIFRKIFSGIGSSFEIPESCYPLLTALGRLDALAQNVIPAVRCPGIPRPCTTWTMRDKSSWPGQEMVSRISKQGVLIVPEADDSSNDFSLTFAPAEEMLIQSMSQEQLLCYRLLLLFNKEVFKEAFKGLDYQHLKYVMFWACESVDAGTWKENGLAGNIRLVAGILKDCVADGNYLPHFFMDQVNVIEKLTTRERQAISRACDRVIQDPLGELVGVGGSKKLVTEKTSKTGVISLSGEEILYQRESPLL